MKKSISYILILALVFVTSCDDDYELADVGLNLDNQLPGYVAFNSAGTSVSLDALDVTESSDSESLNVEVPTGTTSDVTVNYTFGGTAEFGVDFNVEGASSTGGALTINVPTEPQANLIPVNADIVVEFLTDLTQDGNKTLEITLVSASNGQGELAVGRGGTDVLRTQLINISDVDCGDAAGLYDVNGVILVDDFGSGPYNYTDRISLADCATEGAYSIVDISGGLYTNAYATAYDAVPAAAVIVFDPSIDGPVTWTGVSDQFGGEIIEDPASPVSSNYNAATGIITIYWTATAFGERGITTYTLAP